MSPSVVTGAAPSDPGRVQPDRGSVRAQVPPHAELPLIRAFVESLRHSRDDGSDRLEVPATLRRTIETLAAILDLHGEFAAADEARAIVAALRAGS